MRIHHALLLLCFLMVCCAPEKSEQFDLVVQNGRLIDLETGKITEKNIFIVEGRIKKVAEVNDALRYETKKTINATGKFIVPGFWDNHVHFRGGDSLINANKNFLNLFIANGITTVRDAGGDLTTAVLLWRKKISDGTLVGPTIFTSGPKIDGPNGTWAGSLAVESDSDIIKALDALEAIPTDFVKLYDSTISAEAYLKTISEAENRNLITSGHMPFTVELDDTIGAGIDAIEHLYYVMKGCSADEQAITERLRKKEIGFWDAMPLLLESYDQTAAKRTFADLAHNKVFVVPTLHIGKTLSYLDEVDHSTDPYLQYMGKDIIKTYEGRIKRAKNASVKAIADQLTKALDDAGVGLLAGSDSGAYNSYTYPGISLHKEMQEMVANGLSPLSALRTSAYNGSKFLRQENDYGNISEGKIADMVLLDANPLENIENSQKIFSVIKAGRTHSKKELKMLLTAALQN